VIDGLEATVFDFENTPSLAVAVSAGETRPDFESRTALDAAAALAVEQPRDADKTAHLD
jgi:hypothetical protein